MSLHSWERTSSVAPGPFDEETPEMRDVEHSCAVAYGVMLSNDTLVLDGHRPAAEVRETGTELGVEVMQR